MNGIEFFHHPSQQSPADLLWGIHVDGLDLRARTAWATRELWRPELDDQFADQERESADLIWNGHAGLSVGDFAHLHDHFLSDSDSDSDADAPVPLLGCPCGLWFCWPLMARVTPAPTTVVWSSFRYPEREHWGDLPLGPFTFDRAAYETALRSPKTLTKDPLGPAPAGLGV
ncbi:hypothetical protein [Streptomyces sp. NPDC058291]|uniref:hypothetical protein n=1 Tax=Streptomyces sp. NPDC058291 TaxID=3346427 RepID=UPI0036E904DD